MSLGVTAPSLSAKPSQVADRTNRLASLMPLIEVHSNNSAMVIVPFVFLHSCYSNGQSIPSFDKYTSLYQMVGEGSINFRHIIQNKWSDQ
jgi:hypothetical protein